MLFHKVPGKAVEELLVPPQQGRCAASRPYELRVHAFERRHGAVADTVSRIVVGGVRAVLHVLLAALGQQGLHLFPREAQYGPDYPAPALGYAAQAAQARAARQVQQHSLRVVVRRVGRGYGRGAPLVRCALQEVIAQAAGRLLCPEAVLAGEGRHVAAPEVRRDAQARAQRADKGLVPVGLGPSQAVIEVRALDAHIEPRRSLQQQPQQADRIRPAGDGAEHQPAPGQQFEIEPLSHRRAACPRPRRRCTPAAT